jgi:hypothetical protein
MNEIPSPKDLRGAASVAQALAYAAGIAGIVAGALLYQAGELAFAVVAWVLTFAAGAILMIAAFLARGMAALLGRIARMEQDLAELTAASGPSQSEPKKDPWRHTPPY